MVILSSEADLTLIKSGDVPKWLKGPHSKCGRSVIPVPEFKSLHLRFGKDNFRYRKLSFLVKKGSEKLRIRKITFTGIFIALIAIGAFIKIPVGPVPITMQSFFVLLSGIVLGGKYGALSVLIYVILGLLGFPFFSSGGGFGYIVNPGFGFLLGFILSSVCLGDLFGNRKISVLRLFLYAYLSLIPMYITGVLYYIMILKFFINTSIDVFKIFYMCYLIFIPTDIVKCFLIAILGKRLKAVLSK